MAIIPLKYISEFRCRHSYKFYEEVCNKFEIGKLSYQVKITASVLNVREKPNTSSKIVATVKKDQVYIITDVQNGWGLLKSGAGWISLKYTKKL